MTTRGAPRRRLLWTTAVCALVAGISCASSGSDASRPGDAAIDVTEWGDGGDGGDGGGVDGLDDRNLIGSSEAAAPGSDASDGSTTDDALADGGDEAPATIHCTTAMDCPAPMTQCLVATCTGGVCGTQAVPQGTEIAKDSPADCHGTYCDGLGHAQQAIDVTDLPTSTNPCVAGTCSAFGWPGTLILTAGTPCSSPGGKLCDGAGNCVECLHSSDCPAGKVCGPLDSCRDLPASCGDGVTDGTETDIDCGGAICLPCANGRACLVDADCTSDHCDPAVHTCRSALCYDGVQDDGETAVDCGGPACTPCALGQGCQVDQDCLSHGCDATTHACVVNQCYDGIKDGSETDVDCGGGTCPSCAVGQDCLVGSDCLATLACISLRCWAPTCNDGVTDGSETGVDCGGGACPKCALTQPCTLDSDCQSSACDLVSLTCIANQCADHRQDGAETGVDCGGGVCSCCLVGKACKSNGDCCPGHICNGSLQCQ